MTEREAIAFVLGTGLYGFGGRVSASARLKVAEAIVQGLGAAGYDIVPKLRGLNSEKTDEANG